MNNLISPIELQQPLGENNIEDRYINLIHKKKSLNILLTTEEKELLGDGADDSTGLSEEVRQ